MATGLSAYLANKYLDAVGNATSFSVSLPYIKLHVGDPGTVGTANAAIETTRQSASFGSAAGGILTSDASTTWTNIAGSQTATFFTTWDSATAGNFLFSGVVDANPYTAGDTFTITSGSLVVNLTLAS
jgi:hypothetical protein